MSADVKPALAYVEDQQDALLEQLFSLLRIPSVSALSCHRDDMHACAEKLAEHCRAIGMTAEIIPTPGHPAVLARTPPDPTRRTVLVYGHYDVQPVEPLELWDYPPFDPRVVDGNIRARGASDDKGQLFTHLAAVAAYQRTAGHTPVNMVFLIEGEEEIGSPNLDALIAQRRDELACDAIVISDTAMHRPGVPSICHGLRGLVYLEVTLQGPASDLHSGAYGGAVVNPANALARLLAGLHDDEGRVRIDGFYDDVQPMGQEEKATLAELHFDEDAFRQQVGAPALGGEPGFSSLERIGARPTLDINGLVSGHTGEGAKTVLPARATAKFSMRLVPNQDPKAIVRNTIAWLERHCPPTVTMEIKIFSDAPPVLVPLDTPEIEPACAALEDGFGRRPVFMREGGSIPVVATLVRELEAPCLLVGFGLSDDNLHAPNEKLKLDNFLRGIHTSIALQARLAQG